MLPLPAIGVKCGYASVSSHLSAPIFQQRAILGPYVPRIGAKPRSSNGVIPTLEAPHYGIRRDSRARNEFRVRGRAPKLIANARDGIDDVLLVGHESQRNASATGTPACASAKCCKFSRSEGGCEKLGVG